MKKCFIIGVPDDPQTWLHPEVETIVNEGHVFAGGTRHHELMAARLPIGAVWIDITSPMSTVFERLDGYDEVVVFASGDPLFFGFATTVRRMRPDTSIRLYPSFNSLQMLAHHLLLPYHDMRTVSLTGRPWHEFDRALIERSPKTGILTDREHTPDTIARRMLDYGYEGFIMHVGEHLGHPSQQRVRTLTLDEAAHETFSMPNCVILQATKPRPLPFGLPDDAFALLDGREKMITKMPIRLLSLQALDLPQRHVLWDIGFCTGSVSIEARLRFPHLHVEAFEVRPECEAIMATNARRFGVPGITVHMGDFMEMNGGWPSPDAIFIGGHGGQLKAIMAKAAKQLLPGGTIVMNSVTSSVVEHMTDHRPTSRRLWDEACRELGLQQMPSLRIQLNDFNPIEILKAVKAS